MKVSRVRRMSGGDKPKWDADMEYWLADLKEGKWWEDHGRLDGPTYISSKAGEGSSIITGSIGE